MISASDASAQSITHRVPLLEDRRALELDGELRYMEITVFADR
jgi:hypothetical protein